jgi:hypothetical protein
MNGGEFGGGLGYGPVIDLLMLKSGDAAVPSVVGTEQDRASPTRAATTTLAVLLAAAVGSIYGHRRLVGNTTMSSARACFVTMG